MFKQVLIGFAAAAALAASVPAFAGAADFTLANRTGYDLREVYISPANKDNWGKDRMGEYVLENGKSRLFRFADRASCKQDIRVVFDDDESEVTWEDIDLCEINKVTLKYNRAKRTVTADVE